MKIKPNVTDFMELNDREYEQLTTFGPTKVCAICKQSLPLHMFARDRKFLKTACKPCRSKQYDSKNSQLRRKIKEQTHGPAKNCEICKKPFGFGEKPNVDHNHETKNIRGYLCKFCNTLLGKMGDNKENIAKKFEAVVDYLDKYDKDNSPKFLAILRTINERFLS